MTYLIEQGKANRFQYKKVKEHEYTFILPVSY